MTNSEPRSRPRCRGSLPRDRGRLGHGRDALPRDPALHTKIVNKHKG